MIKPADRSVFVDTRRGELEAFEPDRLRGELAACFEAAGRPDQTAFAEDIALAVECALLNTSADGPVPEAELVALIGRVLGEIGLAPVAEAYRRRRGEVDTVPVEPAAVENVLGNPQTARRVTDALRRLGVEHARRELLRELAQALPANRPDLSPHPAAALSEFVPDTVVSAAELLAELPPETAKRFERGQIRFTGVNRVLPSIRFRCFLLPLADELGLTGVTTELELAGPLAAFGAELAQCFETAHRCFRRRVGELEAPDPRRYLFFPDMPTFVSARLGGSWPGGEPLARSVAELVTGRLGPGIICKFR